MKKQYLCFLSFLVSPLLANAADTILLDSAVGDYIGGGNTYTFTDNTGTISLTPSDGELAFSYQSSDHSVRLDFVTPDGEAMAVEHYLNAQRDPFNSPKSPGMAVSMDGRGCNTVNGDFFVHELDLSTADPVVALDFVQYCGNSNAPLTGSIRMNSSLAAPLPYPVAVIDRPLHHLLEGQSITLSAHKSYSGNRTVVSSQWEQVSGPAISLDNASSLNPSFTVPELPLAGSDITLRLTVMDDQGVTNERELSLSLVSKSVPLTFLELHSEDGDYIGQGKDWYFDDAFNVINANLNYDNGISANINTGSNWSTDFAAPYDSPLEQGLYDPAERFPFQDASLAGLNIAGDGRGCNQLSGFFTVLDIAGQGDQVESFMADFTQHCENETNPALTGRIAINARHPSVPSAQPGTDISAGPNETVNLDGRNSTDNSSIASYHWRVDNPDFTLIGADQAVAQVVTPDMTSGDSIIQTTATLTITDSEGFKDQDSVKISVERNNSAPVANDDFVAFSHKHGVTFNPLLNDSDPDGNMDTTTLEIVTSPQYGSTEVLGDGRIRYMPDYRWVKNDSLTYQIKDTQGARSQPATVYLSR